MDSRGTQTSVELSYLGIPDVVWKEDSLRSADLRI